LLVVTGEQESWGHLPRWLFYSGAALLLSTGAWGEERHNAASSDSVLTSSPVELQTPAHSAQETPETGAAVAAGMQVVVDPATGEILDSAAEETLSNAPFGEQPLPRDALLEESWSVAPGDLQVQQLSDGTKVLDLQGHFWMATEVKVGSSGDLQLACSPARSSATIGARNRCEGR